MNDMSSTTKLIDVSPDVKIFAIITQPAHRPKAGTPTLVFLHYWGGSSRTWSLVTPPLSSHPTDALDFRGWGNSTGPGRADGYSITALADDVQAVIEALGLDSVVLVGLSIGRKSCPARRGPSRCVGSQGGNPHQSGSSDTAHSAAGDARTTDSCVRYRWVG